MSQLLLNTVDRMEKRTAIHIEATTAEPPIRAQKKMEAENLMFEFIESALRDQAEIGHVFLIAATPHPAPFRFPAFAAMFPTGNADVFLFECAVPKSRVAGAKYGPEHAVTRGCLASNGAVPEAPAVANSALLASQCDRFRTVPMHVVECPSGRHSLLLREMPRSKTCF
jgi:hypothetical protein